MAGKAGENDAAAVDKIEDIGALETANPGTD